MGKLPGVSIPKAFKNATSNLVIKFLRHLCFLYWFIFISDLICHYGKKIIIFLNFIILRVFVRFLNFYNKRSHSVLKNKNSFIAHHTTKAHLNLFSIFRIGLYRVSRLRNFLPSWKIRLRCRRSRPRLCQEGRMWPHRFQRKPLRCQGLRQEPRKLPLR